MLQDSLGSVKGVIAQIIVALESKDWHLVKKLALTGLSSLFLHA